MKIISTPIKSTPVLYGKDAKAFYERIQNPKPVSKEEKERILNNPLLKLTQRNMIDITELQKKFDKFFETHTHEDFMRWLEEKLHKEQEDEWSVANPPNQGTGT